MTIIKCRDRELVFGRRTLCMGILNVTPDSFSDGGKNFGLSSAVTNALQMVDDGADVIDIGGESTRPGYTEISCQEEIDRIVPVIETLRRESDVIISVDTYKSEVAKAALKAGAHIINDITGFMADANMAPVVKEYEAGAILMFNARTKGESEGEITGRAMNELLESIDIAHRAGITDDYLILDPGIGFGTTREQETELIHNLKRLSFDGRYPVLLALSRKRLAGEILMRPTLPDERDSVSIGLGLAGVFNGAGMLRVHNVKDTVDALRGFDRLFY